MILQEIKNYVRKREQVSLNDIALHFDLDADTVRGMLDFWVRKGRIKRLKQTSDCGGACSCSAKEARDIYRWNPQIGNISIES